VRQANPSKSGLPRFARWLAISPSPLPRAATSWSSRRGGSRRRPCDPKRCAKRTELRLSRRLERVTRPKNLASAPPGGILTSHASDQVANLGVEFWAADRVRPRLSPLVELEAPAVPGKDRGGPDDEEAESPARPAPRQPNPEDPIPSGQAWSAPPGAVEDGELMTQRQVLEGDGGRPDEKRTEERRDGEQ
jgi:hypothetical protein